MYKPVTVNPPVLRLVDIIPVTQDVQLTVKKDAGMDDETKLDPDRTSDPGELILPTSMCASS